MTYAVINNGIVENLVHALDRLQSNWEPVPINTPVAIGDSFDRIAYYSPEGKIRMAPDIELLKNHIDELENKNAFLEECLAEVATKLYS